MIKSINKRFIVHEQKSVPVTETKQNVIIVKQNFINEINFTHTINTPLEEDVNEKEVKKDEISGENNEINKKTPEIKSTEMKQNEQKVQKKQKQTNSDNKK